MRIDLFDYPLPDELIARHPPADRDGGRLMLLAGREPPRHHRITDLPELIPRGALVVANDTRVIPARLFGKKPSGGRVELLLVERLDASDPKRERWRALARASKAIAAPSTIAIEGDELGCEVVRAFEPGEPTIEVILSASRRATVTEALEACGHVPLPPYLRREDTVEDRERYQTIFARHAGSVAAPTAGLHLSERVMEGFAARGIERAYVTLHVSLGTFKPVTVEDLDHHPMHEEHLVVGEDVAGAIEAARARAAPVYAIGTTAVRALESAADPKRPGHVAPTRASTRLLIQPGYRFRVVDGLLTNFHLPRSTLLALVSAFAGRERVLAAYASAIEQRYRFFSYGDAMLLAPDAKSPTEST